MLSADHREQGKLRIIREIREIRVIRGCVLQTARMSPKGKLP